MKTLVVISGLLFSHGLQAHHTRDHMMLTEDAAQVVAATREGSSGLSGWIPWAILAVALLLGLVRWWQRRP